MVLIGLFFQGKESYVPTWKFEVSQEQEYHLTSVQVCINWIGLYWIQGLGTDFRLVLLAYWEHRPMPIYSSLVLAVLNTQPNTQNPSPTPKL